MSQHDYNIANQTFPATRTDLNNALGAVATNNSGNSQPATTYPNQWWYDSDDNKLYLRNSDNDNWVSILTIGATSDLQTITTDLISEVTSAAGVTIDGLLIKDGGIGAAGTTSTIAGISIASENNSIFMSDSDILDTTSTAAFDTVYGWGAGKALTTGDSNTFMGYLAGAAVTTGQGNIMIGESAGDGFDTEGNNLGIGNGALGGSIAGGEYNVAVGNYTLDALTSGDGNTALGYQAGTALTTGNVTAIGHRAGDGLTTGGGAIHIGYDAGRVYDTENHNIGIGNYSLGSSIAGGEYNVAIGSFALDSLTSGDNNTAIGYNSGTDLTTGEADTLVGNHAGENITTGNHNVFMGYVAGNLVTTSSQNIIIGSLSDHASAGGVDGAVVIGYNVQAASSGTRYITLGYASDLTYIAPGSSSWSGTSDLRLKENINDHTLGLDFVNDLRPVTYNWKKEKDVDESLHYYKENSDKRVNSDDEEIILKHGFIAQEVKQIIDDNNLDSNCFGLWSKQDDGTQGLAEGELTPILVKAVQELSAQVTTLQQELKTIKGE